MLAGGMVAAAIGGDPAASIAESVAARSGDLVAREAPGSNQAEIAILRGNERVRLIGERDDWSEILLPDGRRAWVPTAEIARVDEAPRARVSPIATAEPAPAATAAEARGPDPDAVALRDEVKRLRGIVDQLSLWQPDPARASASVGDETSWIVAGAALVVGVFVGGAWERHRSRRERSLRF